MTKQLPHSQLLNQFCKKFDIHVEHSNRKFQRVVNHPVDWYVDKYCDTDFNIHSYQSRVENVDVIALHIPVNRLEELLTSIPEQYYKEMEIRTAVPAVKKAYENYRLLLKMCGGDHDAGY